MNHLVFKKITPQDAEYADVFELRETILRKPIGLSLHDEDLSNEVNDHILTANNNGQLAGCLILSPKESGVVQLRQMAVAASQQGNDVGRQLVQYAEQFARDNGYTRIMLHARITAQGFYDKLGYTALGDVFTEVGIPHIEMEKQIG
jgi:predicted GNAT family N-acyltransferase